MDHSRQDCEFCQRSKGEGNDANTESHRLESGLCPLLETGRTRPAAKRFILIILIFKGRKQMMKKLIAATIAFLIFSVSTFASGGVWITISGNSGQTNTQATEFRYSQSPRDLAGGSSSMAAVNAGTSARGAGAG